MNEVTSAQMQIIHDSWNHVVTSNSDFGLMFYEKLFHVCPHFKTLFSEDILAQSFRLTSIISSLIYRFDGSRKINIYLRRLGEKHRTQFRVHKGYYMVLCEVFVSTLQESSGSWNSELEEAWRCLYAQVVNKMTPIRDDIA